MDEEKHGKPYTDRDQREKPDAPYKPEQELIRILQRFEPLVDFRSDVAPPRGSRLHKYKFIRYKRRQGPRIEEPRVTFRYVSDKFVIGDYECMLTFDKDWIKLTEKDLGLTYDYTSTYYLDGIYAGKQYLPPI